MARTIRKYHSGMCLRTQANHPHKVQKAMLKDIVSDDVFDFKINLGNRALFGDVPEPYDDICIAALYETKQQWKHDRLPRPLKRYRG
jgi:hypothetical protein